MGSDLEFAVFSRSGTRGRHPVSEISVGHEPRRRGQSVKKLRIQDLTPLPRLSYNTPAFGLRSETPLETAMIRSSAFLAVFAAVASPAFAHHGPGSFELGKTVTYENAKL